MLSEQSKLLLSGFLDNETTEILNKKNIYTTEELLTKSQMPVHEDRVYVFGTALRNRLLMRKQHSNQDFIANATFLEVSQLSELLSLDDSGRDLGKDNTVSKAVVNPPKAGQSNHSETSSEVSDETEVISKEQQPLDVVAEQQRDDEQAVQPHLSNGAPLLRIAYHQRNHVNVFLSDFAPVINAMSTQELREKVASYFAKN